MKRLVQRFAVNTVCSSPAQDFAVTIFLSCISWQLLSAMAPTRQLFYDFAWCGAVE